MAHSKLETLISVDVNKKPNEQPVPLHNRWHPDIPAVRTVEPGAQFRIECLDWTGGQIKNNDSADDVLKIDLNQVHYLSGPIAVRGAEPGDILVVDIMDIGPLPGHEWGYTGIFAKENGGSFLTDHFPNAAKAIWDLQGAYAQSRHIPGVKFAGIAHPGLIGVAPSRELLTRWNKRETDLFKTNPTRVPALACLPDVHGALVGQLKGADADRVAREAARTVPPRENGGNGDITCLARESRIYFPVYVKDALLSMGDLHFSEGDGEISFCGAIEMAGFISLKVDIIKGGATHYNLQQPIFKKTAAVENPYSNFLVFEGISVDEKDKQYYMDASMSFQRACLNAIDYLKKFGYTGEQACILLSAAPVEARIKAIVDIPNCCATIAIPTEIFDFDLVPSHHGPTKKNRGDVARAR
jgi:formamidase